eukprot:CAMPEP_0202734400 /NCGR_PEP_ID=MMETSP1385-20130828/188664_1 /ASSEMBLY_ACC=CAM_ASM_000861 /TAXON_ID=933848 /ORGANISM="Elphidium margaritaceum" /LENGTH=156 /DNA_ID=CAMNT_0049400761 /DNA_START=588 /DNA_END=1058 /DNA_ORIENTATION=-
MAVFIKKLKDLVSDHERNDIETEQLVRKLIVCGSVAMFSTFIFYTFAIPFWPNLTFLLPFDAMVNSLCAILLLDYAYTVYIKLCCCLDGCMKHVLQHTRGENVQGRMSMMVLSAEKKNEHETEAQDNDKAIQETERDARDEQLQSKDGKEETDEQP